MVVSLDAQYNSPVTSRYFSQTHRLPCVEILRVRIDCATALNVLCLNDLLPKVAIKTIILRKTQPVVSIQRLQPIIQETEP